MFSESVARSFFVFVSWIQALVCTPVILMVLYILTRFAVSWIQALVCTPVILMVLYILTRFAECLVSRGISPDTRKLAQTST